MDYEVSIATRGDCDAALAALIPHAASEPFKLRLVTPAPPSGAGIIETLGRMGCTVEVTLVDSLNLARARARQIDACRAEVLVSIDDDAALAPVGAIRRLADAVSDYPWAAPVVRFVQNHRNPPVGHTEIWEPTDEHDPRVVSAVAAQGTGWRRVFDLSHDIQSTQLPGTCFVVNVATARQHTALLREWRPDLGSEDVWLGAKLGTGLILHDVYAYHWGNWSPGKWNAGFVASQLAERFPSVYHSVATLAREEEHGQHSTG